MNAQQKSIKKNFLYNIALKLLNMIFPIITFPYVARILSAEGIGRVDFSFSVIQYFILLSQIGIPTYAIRQCAKYRDDKEKLTKTVQELLLINSIMIIISYALLILSIHSIDRLQDYKALLFIMSVNILLTNIGIEWFYQAIEEYRLIAIRSFIVKLISTVSVFYFVREENDVIVYGIITALSVSLNFVYNFIYVNKYIQLFKRFKTPYNFRRHIRPILVLFSTSLAVSIYINLDKVMLGFIAGDKAVGLYTAAHKVIIIILAVVTALGTVLLPRMSYYLEHNKRKEVETIIKKSFDFIFMISIPAVAGIILLAKPIITLFAGGSYLEAIITIKILGILIIIIGLSNLIGIQILVSHGKEKAVLISTIVGAILNFSLNLALIPNLQQNGAALSTLIAEIGVIVLQIYFAYSYIRGNINYKNILHYLLGTVLIFITISIINSIDLDLLVIKTILSVLISTGIYLMYLYYMKNELVNELLNKTILKLRSRKG